MDSTWCAKADVQATIGFSTLDSAKSHGLIWSFIIYNCQAGLPNETSNWLRWIVFKTEDHLDLNICVKRSQAWWIWPPDHLKKKQMISRLSHGRAWHLYFMCIHFLRIYVFLVSLAVREIPWCDFFGFIWWLVLFPWCLLRPAVSAF